MTNSVTRAGKSGERGARLKSVEGGRGAPVIHEEVYERLRRAIIAGQFEPGKSLSVRGLAAEFGVSAMPAREAIRRLAALGALEVTETRRVMVAHMTPERFDELTIARRTLEPEIAALAARKLAKDAKTRDALIAKLKTIDAALDEAIARGDIADYGRRNSEFHFALYAAAKAPVLLSLVESLWLQTGPFMRIVIGRLGTTSLVTYDTLGAVILAPSIYIVLNFIESNFVTPTLMGARLTINPLAVILNISFWTFLWGPIGAVLSIPMLVIFKTVCDYSEFMRPLSILLGDSQTFTPRKDGPVAMPDREVVRVRPVARA